MFTNLLLPVLDGSIEPSRLAGTIDKDYIVFIWQARRFLYGDLSERELRRYQARGAPLRRFKGVMAYYPLIDDTGMLADLDRWLAAEVWLTMRRRQRQLTAMGIAPLPAPLGLSRRVLIRYQGVSSTTGQPVDLRLPSFRRVANVIRSAAKAYGPNTVGQGASAYAY
jgi:hypothetical protein